MVCISWSWKPQIPNIIQLCVLQSFEILARRRVGSDQIVFKELHYTFRNFNWAKFYTSFIPQKNLQTVLVFDIYYHNNAYFNISLYRSASRILYQTKFREKLIAKMNLWVVSIGLFWVFFMPFCTMEYISNQAEYFPLPSKFPHFKCSNCYFFE